MNNLTRENLPALLPFKDDLIFKTMLTHPGADLMRNSIISAFTGLKIVESDVMQNEPGLDMSYAEKPIRFDVTCTTDTGKRVNIEMQAHRMEGDNAANAHENLRCRSIYYTSKLFVMQTAARYSELNQTFHIMICDYTVFDDEKFLHRFVYADGGLKLTDICSIIYVELPKIKDRLQ
jgi:predicted transposase/invertase (TIGR01784 family)